MLTCDPLIGALERLLQTLADAAGGAPAATGLSWDSATQAATAAILGESPTFAAIYTKVSPGITAVGPADPARFDNPDQVARAGRSSTGGILIQIMPSRALTVPKLAFVMAHEYGHAEQIHDRGFTSTEAAPFLTLDEYILLRRDGELQAFQTQLAVTNEIVASATTPAADRDAMKSERFNDERVRLLHLGRNADARRLIKDEYTVAALTAEYDVHSAPDPSSPYEAAVNAFKVSPDWPSPAGW